MKFKKILLFIIILVFQKLVFSQETKTYHSQDTILFSDYTIFNNNYFSFLIQDDIYYDFYIFDIIPLKNGYFIHCVTVIDTLTVSAFVITDRENENFFTKKIQKEEIYSLSLKRYNEIPIEPYWWSYRNIDVLIGDDNISVGFVGLFNYIFTTKNLNGLSYVDSIKVKKRLKKYVFEKNKIKNTIEPFLKAISYKAYSQSFIQSIDTTLFKESIKNHSYETSKRKRPLKINNDIPFSPDIINWETEYRINNNDFVSQFWFLIRDYFSLPLESNIDTNFAQITNLKIELLHISKERIYTLRTRWNLEEKGKEYIAILNIKKQKNKYKIIGFRAGD